MSINIRERFRERKFSFLYIKKKKKEAIVSDILEDGVFIDLETELKKRGREDIMVCIGGVIPVQDYDHLYESGAVAIFAPGTNIPEAGIKLLNLLIDRVKEETAEG